MRSAVVLLGLLAGLVGCSGSKPQCVAISAPANVTVHLLDSCTNATFAGTPFLTLNGNTQIGFCPTARADAADVCPTWRLSAAGQNQLLVTTAGYHDAVTTFDAGSNECGPSYGPVDLTLTLNKLTCP